MQIQPSKKNLLQYIGDNVDVLENKLNVFGKRFIALRQIKHNLNFEGHCTHDELEKIASHVFARVREILNARDFKDAKVNCLQLQRVIKQALFGVAGMEAVSAGCLAYYTIVERIPTLREIILQSTTIGIITGILGMIFATLAATARYDKRKGVLEIGFATKATAPTVIAHEYAHHVLIQSSNQEPNHAISEGHARVVQDIIANEFAEQTSNPAYTYVNTKVIARELMSAYRKVCGKKNITPNAALINMPIKGSHGLFSTPYVLGTATMNIATEKEGLCVLEQVAKNDFSFLEK